MAERRRGGCLAALVALPALALLVAGLLAAFVPRALWPVQLVAIGLPYVAWAAAGLAIALAGAGRRRWALALALPVAVVAFRAWPGVGPGAADGDLVLMSFNFPVLSGTEEASADSMVSFITRTAPHVIAMQDSWIFPAGEPGQQPANVRVLVEDGSPYAAFAPARLVPRDGWKEDGMGTPLLARTRPRRADPGAGVVEVLDQEEIALGTVAETSVALRTHVRWHGREAILYNVHLRSYGEPKPWADTLVAVTRPRTWWPYVGQYRRVFAERHAEAERLAERIAGESHPVVVMGDFNSTADHYTVRLIRHARPGAPLVDAYRDAAGWRWGRTYHARRPVVRIDFVLADPAFVVAAARTFPVTYSDHRPVEIRLRWRSPPPAEDSTAAAAADSLDV